MAVAELVSLLMKNKCFAETTIRRLRGRAKAFEGSHPFVDRTQLPLFLRSAVSLLSIE